ncbi:uncharacterized protein LOC135500247 [Lineus longissimus]|uniref:uncharacterized protein LOC135500247 n=1 Tax=Lineus longissimus TaxID=88925 RepID=UPI002B4ED662
MKQLLFIFVICSIFCGVFCGLCNECFYNGNFTEGESVNINDAKMDEFRRRIARLGLGFKDYLKNQKACLEAERHNDGEVANLGTATGRSCAVVNFEYERTHAIFRRAYYDNIQACINNVKEKISEYEKNVACCKAGLEWNLKECRDGRIIRDGTVLGAASLKVSMAAITLALLFTFVFVGR